MNIEKIFSLSFKLFNATIRSVLPFIVLYSIFFILINYFTNFSEFSEEYLLSTTNNTYDLLSLFIVYGINLLYSIVIIQFIFSKITNTSINLNLVTISALRITGLYIIIFMPSILIIISLFSFIPAADIFLLAIPVLYFITFFSQYLIIAQQKNIVESIILSYNIVKQNLSKVIILVFINITFIILMVYLAAIIGSVLPIAINSILLNIQSYFISIFNIQFYYLITSQANEKHFSE